MANIISKNNILTERLKNIKIGEGDLILKLFQCAEELGLGNAIELENLFSFAAMEFVTLASSNSFMIQAENMYRNISNVYYVTELYLTGYNGSEYYMSYEDFITNMKNGKAKEIIKESHAKFNLHVNRLKHIISKCKRKIPKENSQCFRNIRNLLSELEVDLSIAGRYPTVSANLPEFYFGRYYSEYGPVQVKKWLGFMQLEKTIYNLYNELSILSRLDSNSIREVYRKYTRLVGTGIPFNLFEKVINNYLFALPYSDIPENLNISKTDAKLIINEIRLGTINASELIEQMIEKKELTGHNADYLRKYGAYVQEKIDILRQSEYFGELFIANST